MTAAGLTAAGEQSLRESAEDNVNASETENIFPRFKGAGAVYRITGAPDLDPNQTYKLLLDVTAAGPKDKIHSSVEHAARALNLFALAGAPNDKVSVAVVVHSKATPIVLSDAAYRRAYGTPNPNSDLIRRLSEAGVDIRVCGQAMHHHGFPTSDVLPSVIVDLSAMTTLVELQKRDYALIPD
jgi:intracellular sulfur oxidation DsrE/DsrF family protein